MFAENSYFFDLPIQIWKFIKTLSLLINITNDYELQITCGDNQIQKCIN